VSRPEPRLPRRGSRAGTVPAPHSQIRPQAPTGRLRPRPWQAPVLHRRGSGVPIPGGATVNAGTEVPPAVSDAPSTRPSMRSPWVGGSSEAAQRQALPPTQQWQGYGDRNFTATRRGRCGLMGLLPIASTRARGRPTRTQGHRRGSDRCRVGIPPGEGPHDSAEADPLATLTIAIVLRSNTNMVMFHVKHHSEYLDPWSTSSALSDSPARRNLRLDSFAATGDRMGRERPSPSRPTQARILAAGHSSRRNNPSRVSKWMWTAKGS